MKTQNNVDTYEHFNEHSDCLECRDCVFARGGEMKHGNVGAEGTCLYFEAVGE